MKRFAWWEILFWIVIGLSIIGTLHDWLYEPPKAGAFDSCGPGHHWIPLHQNVADNDLSCEED